LKELRVIWKYS